ncbi:MAG: hypothetical protein JXR37_25115 [Kiritimatiellae bacterium]|nr:hypothetical protein [Kiritimatiellia bacterium]
MTKTREAIRDELEELPVYDVHSHLGQKGKWKAESLRDIVDYHWLRLELERAAGKPFDPEWNDATYMANALPHFPAIRNTSTHYGFLGILRDLYGFKDPLLTTANWRQVDEAVRAGYHEQNRVRKVLDRAGIRKVTVRQRDFLPDTPRDVFVPYEGGEAFLAPVHCGQLKPFAGAGQALPETPDAFGAALRRAIDEAAAQRGVRLLHIWVKGAWTYQPDVAAATVKPLLQKLRAGEQLSEPQANTFDSWASDLCAEAAAAHRLVCQLFHGMTIYTDTASVSAVTTWHPGFLRGLAYHFDRHRRTLYDLFLGTRYPSHEAASLARVYPNLMVSGAWWHAFTAGTLGEFFSDRLDMLPNTVWNAFYSDGYRAEWVYGKLCLTRHCLAHALADRVDAGFFSRNDALEIARNVLWENPLRAYGE